MARSNSAAGQCGRGLSAACAPEAVLGEMPVIYPFIVNNPGEAAQAKRRIAALTIGQYDAFWIEAGSHGATAELEALFDEYASAQSLDARRTRLPRRGDPRQARASQVLLMSSGIGKSPDPMEALAKLDAWLCDLKEMRIGDGLHVLGQDAPGEIEAILHALSGGFVEPGPAGAPSRGRLDVLPTGRNLFTIDPRAVPTRTAWEIGSRTATEVMTRHAQDQGDWPRRIVIDLWGSASMRTGGDDIAQGLALLGVRPLWDDTSTRVSGFEILSIAKLGRPRVDVTMRVSGLFRDVFPAQIALFSTRRGARRRGPRRGQGGQSARGRRCARLPASQAASSRACTYFRCRSGRLWDRHRAEPRGRRVLVARRARRSLSRRDLACIWRERGGRGRRGCSGLQGARSRVPMPSCMRRTWRGGAGCASDADAFAEHAWAVFAAAAKALGAEPALYHADTSIPAKSTVRSLDEEIARVLRGRATNPRWIEGQMRHGYRGAAEIAETVDNLFAFAALTDSVASRHFDLLYDAVCGDETVRAFLQEANPEAAPAPSRGASRKPQDAAS